jgi:hypothetical protein
MVGLLSPTSLTITIMVSGIEVSTVDYGVILGALKDGRNFSNARATAG